MDEKNAESTDRAEGAKKPYQRPQIVYREPLEAMAAVCVPSPPAKADPGACPRGPLQS